MSEFFVKTKRLGLRSFRASDEDQFAALNADQEVMKYFPKRLSRDETAYFIERANRKINEQGFGFWAAEHLESGKLAGMIGITRVSYETRFTPAVEIGWRLAKDFWGKGLATEGANGALDFGFQRANLDEIVSFTAVMNKKSARVMQRLGMIQDGEFDHPKIADGHPLQRHVLYRLAKSDWSAMHDAKI